MDQTKRDGPPGRHFSACAPKKGPPSRLIIRSGSLLLASCKDNAGREKFLLGIADDDYERLTKHPNNGGRQQPEILPPSETQRNEHHDWRVTST
jgi:hypothetical protein